MMFDIENFDNIVISFHFHIDYRIGVGFALSLSYNRIGRQISTFSIYCHVFCILGADFVFLDCNELSAAVRTTKLIKND